MTFNSLEFAVFFIVVYSLYLILPHRAQNGMLLIASYVFYGWWDWRFLGLLFISTAVDYGCSLKIDGSTDAKKRKQYLLIAVFTNLGFLGFFKYFNFFAAGFENFESLFGWRVHSVIPHIILPVGISFYTFQAMSYTIDVYRREMKAEKNFFDFALFVSFFPQLVAGPIERAKDLLPQVIRPRHVQIDEVYRGFYLILWGLYQKVFIADNLAKIVDPVYASSGHYHWLTILLVNCAGGIQIFCDFAGYSDIARGLGKCMGFEIMVNFNLPFFATNPWEFWRRWHISLSTWLRDYLYRPLVRNSSNTFVIGACLTATMLLGGLWHGASWTFVFWGGYQALLMILYFYILRPLFGLIVFPQNSWRDRLWFIFRMSLFFFLMFCVGGPFFRAKTLSQSFRILGDLFHWHHEAGWNYPEVDPPLKMFLNIMAHVGFLLLMQTFCYLKKDLLIIFRWPMWIRSLIYILMVYTLVLYGAYGGEPFIYFRF